MVNCSCHLLFFSITIESASETLDLATRQTEWWCKYKEMERGRRRTKQGVGLEGGIEEGGIGRGRYM